MDDIIKTAQQSTKTQGVTIFPRLKMFDLDYADDVVCLSESEFETQDALSRLQIDTICDLHLAKCKFTLKELR